MPNRHLMLGLVQNGGSSSTDRHTKPIMLVWFCIKLSKSVSNARLCVDFYRIVVVFQTCAVSNPLNSEKEYSVFLFFVVVRNRSKIDVLVWLHEQPTD